MYRADSRLVEKGDIFFALPGARNDGHSFLEEIQKKGALAAYVKHDYSGPDFGLELFRVPDPLMTLQLMAKKKMQQFKGRVIAITGSVGKTTTKELIAQLLAAAYKIAKTQKSQNTKITLPLTILNDVKGDEDWVVLEMGMTHPGDIGKLVEIAPPDIAVLTQVTFVHAVNFSSLEEIYKYKCEIFSSEKTNIKIHYDSFTLSQEMVDACPLPGEHNLKNLANAVAACLAAGMSEKDILKGIPHLKLPEKRLELVKKEGITFLNDAYNACWLSMRGAMDTFREMEGRKLAVFGDMKELGSISKEMHENVLNYAESFIDQVFLLGPEWNLTKIPANCVHFMDKKELNSALRQSVQQGDSILLKGSNSHQLWTIPEDIAS